MTFYKGHPYGKRIKKNQRLSPKTEFKKGNRPWNYGLAKKYNCQICRDEFENRSNGKPKYCLKCLPQAKVLIAKKNAEKRIGIKLNKEHREKISKTNKKNKVWKVLFKPEVRKKAIKTSREKLLGQPSWNRGGKAPWAKGKNNINWKGGISTENEKQRSFFRTWIQKEVLKRDDYTCQICGVRGVVLHVDHIQPWSEYVDLRFCMNNCRTLCQECHYKLTFGKPISEEKSKNWGITKRERRNFGDA